MIHGHRKLAAGTISGVTLAPVVQALWNQICAPYIMFRLAEVLPHLDLTMGAASATQIGALIAAFFFWLTNEDKVYG